jgi:DNA invertase Pin-like site-specific DNA recombinase
MNAGIYARYSSENQRPESIDDQISACRKFARDHGYTVSDEHVFSDQAASGARKDRTGLATLLAAAETRAFAIVLVDDLSRLARDNYLMLSVLAELRFSGVRVVSVADGLDSDDEEATLGIQVRGIFNELQLRDLRKKTLRGQIGQKDRGFFVGERTFGYKSVPVGELRMDKKGRPRPEGYRMTIEPREAAVVRRAFREFADGIAIAKIVKRFNEEGVLGRFLGAKRWSPATIHRMLRNEKYVGRWVWNRTEFRRDPRNGRRRQFVKPESQWIVHKDENLRIVPGPIWELVQARLTEVAGTWPGGKGRRGFERQQGGRVRYYPTHLLSGAMNCGRCGGSIAQVSGKGGGYYGCLAAARGRCENKLLVRRTLTERVVLDAVRQVITQSDNVQYAIERAEVEIRRLLAGSDHDLHLKRAELEAEERRVTNFIEFIAEGRGSRALAEALRASERKVEALRCEIDQIERHRSVAFEPPPRPWIDERLVRIHELLERRTERSALLLRKFLAPMRLSPVKVDVGRPYYEVNSAIEPLALFEPYPELGDADTGSNSLREWS